MVKSKYSIGTYVNKRFYQKIDGVAIRRYKTGMRGRCIGSTQLLSLTAYLRIAKKHNIWLFASQEEKVSK